VVIVLGAVLGLVALLARRSLWRVVMRTAAFVLVLTIAACAAMLLAGPRWPWIAAAVVLLVALGVTWTTVRWARAVHAVAIARLVWIGWHWVMDIRDGRAWARTGHPLPPPSS
jgi:Ca2+/Na+ antiporter